MSGVLDWSPPWSKSVGELAPIAPTSALPASAPVNSCIAHPPAFPGLELAVPHDAAAGIETLVEHALGDTVAGIEHLPTPAAEPSRGGAARCSSSATAFPKLASRWRGMPTTGARSSVAKPRMQLTRGLPHGWPGSGVGRKERKHSAIKSMPGTPNRRSPTVAPSTPGWRWRRSKGG